MDDDALGPMQRTGGCQARARRGCPKRLAEARGSVADHAISHSQGQSIALTRDTQGRITRIEDADGDVVSYEYDAHGDLRAKRSAAGHRTRTQYAPGQPHHLSKLIDAQGVEQALFTYDAEGRLIQTCGPENHCVRNDHDLMSRTEWFIDGEEELRHIYDERGNVLTETNTLEETWTYTYNERDKLLTSTSPMGEVTRHSYDRNGNLLSKTEPHEADENPADFTTSYTYGNLDRRTSMTLPSGGSFHWTYDPRGNELTTKDGSGNTLRTYVRDNEGRILEETNRFGTYRHEYKYGVERWTLPFTTTDPLGRVTTYYRNGKGRVLRQTKAASPCGSRTAVTSASCLRITAAG